MNNYQIIVKELIDRYEHDVREGFIDCYLPDNLCFGDLLDFVNNHLYGKLYAELNYLSYADHEEYKNVVLNTAFRIMDDAELINGDMRDIFEKEFM